MSSTNKIFKTSNYPEALSIHKVKGQNVQLRFYGQDSDYNRLAMISHYLHNTDLLSAEDRKIAVGYIKDFIRSIKPDASDEHTSMICENPFQSSLFDRFPDKYNIVVSHAEIRRQTGNSVAVPMIRSVANKIINLL